MQDLSRRVDRLLDEISMHRRARVLLILLLGAVLLADLVRLLLSRCSVNMQPEITPSM